MYRVRRSRQRRTPWEIVPLNPGPLGILLPIGGGGFALPGRLQGQVMIVAAHGDRAPGTARTEQTALTGAAVFARESNLDDLSGAVIDRRCH